MYRTIGEVKAQLSAGKTVVSIVQDYLTEIEKQQELNAFLEVFTESVLEQAQQVDEKIKVNTLGQFYKYFSLIGTKAIPAYLVFPISDDDFNNNEIELSDDIQLFNA